MKFAPIVAGSALALLLLALATATPFAPPRKFMALDFAGIDTVEVRGNVPRIQISSRWAPQVSYTNELDAKLEVQRTGNRLVITDRSKSIPDVLLSIPASVRAIDVQGANIVTKERLKSMQVSASFMLTWEGDIDRLDLRDSADHSKLTRNDDCDCGGPVFTVSDGRIAVLTMSTPQGRLTLSQPDKIDAAYAWMGNKGGVTLENARRFDNIHVLPNEAQLPDASGPKPSTNP